MKKWTRVRFKANFDDSRPIIFPPLGPTWESGLSGDESYAIRIAYFPKDQLHRLKEFWPEADDIDILEDECEIEFTGRFQCPDWWDEKNECNK